MFGQKKFSPYNSGIPGCLLFFLIFSSGINSIGQQPEYESNIVYDTIYVYDTIWTYETVYDTVWVYDTIYIDEALEQNLTTLQPVSNPLLTGETDNFQLTIEPALYTLTYNADKKLKQKKPAAKKEKQYQGKYRETDYSMLTLNPIKGVFDPGLFLMGTFSLEGYAGPVFQNSQYSFFNENEKNEDVKNASVNLPGWEYGIRLNYDLFQISFQTGIGLLQLNEKLNYEISYYQLDSTLQTEQLEKIITVYDTAQIVNTDDFLNGNYNLITYPYQYDSLTYVDSVYYVPDSVLMQQATSKIIRHYVLEIPMLFEYNWKLSRSNIRLKVGGINQLHLYSKGKAYSDYDSVDEINEAVSFTKYNLALYGSLGYAYDLSQNLKLGFYAYYKYPLRKFSRMFNASVYKQTYGVDFSVQYRF